MHGIFQFCFKILNFASKSKNLKHVDRLRDKQTYVRFCIILSLGLAITVYTSSLLCVSIKI